MATLLWKRLFCRKSFVSYLPLWAFQSNVSKGISNRQLFTAILPNVYFNQQLGENKNLRISYNGSTAQPTASQMQEVVNKSSPLYWTTGNQNLRQEFVNNFSIEYNSFDIDTYRSFFFTANFSNYYNKITNSVLSKSHLIRTAGLLSIEDSIPQGVQLFLPTNAHGAYSVMGNMNISSPIFNGTGKNISATTVFIFSRDINLVDYNKNFINTLILGQDIRVDVHQGAMLDLALRVGVQYNNVKSPLQPVKLPAYIVYTAAAEFSFNLPHNFILACDFDYRINKGMAEGFNQNFLLWNASMSKLVFRNKKGEVKLYFNDLLNKNQNLMRHVFNNSIEESRTTVLRRYALLSFIYHLSTSFGKTKR